MKELCEGTEAPVSKFWMIPMTSRIVPKIKMKVHGATF